MIEIRPYAPSDVPLLFEAARESGADIYPWLRWCHPAYSLDEAQEWVAARAEAFRSGREYEFAIVDKPASLDRAGTGRFVGGCGLNAIRPNPLTANLGYWVRTSARGGGIAPAAVRLLVKWAREHTRLQRIEVLVAAGNTASLRVAEKAGAVRERVHQRRLALHGARHDAVVFSFTLVEEDSNVTNAGEDIRRQRSEH